MGNISWSGNARMRYIKDTKGDDSWNGRVRIAAKGQVNDSTYVYGRFSTGNVDLKDSGDANVTMDRLYVHHDFGTRSA